MPKPAKPKLGQHWLADRLALEAMVEAAGVGPQDTVLEVGPGQGALTARLLKTGARVTAVELDESLADALGRAFAGHQRLEIVRQDIRRFDLGRLPAGYVVAANIPYYLTSPLIKRLITAANPPRRLALLVQKEVAERLGAGPGDMSIMAVATQLFGQVSLGPVVPAAAFDPPPKVDSRIVVIDRLAEPLVKTRPDDLMALVRHGFANRRKTLINSLAGGLKADKAQMLAALRRAEIADNARAQDLGLEQWEKLYNQVSEII